MQQSRSLSRRQVVIFALITAACVAGDSMLYVVLPVHWKSAGLASLWEVGLLLSLNRLARLPLNPFAGWAYSRMSTKTGAVLAGLLAVGTTLGYGLVEGLAAWAVLRILWGLSWSFLKLGGLLTVMDVANLLGISRASAYELVRQENFPKLKIVQGRTIIPRDRLLEWLDEQTRYDRI